MYLPFFAAGCHWFWKPPLRKHVNSQFIYSGTESSCCAESLSGIKESLGSFPTLLTWICHWSGIVILCMSIALASKANHSISRFLDALVPADELWFTDWGAGQAEVNNNTDPQRISQGPMCVADYFSWCGWQNFTLLSGKGRELEREKDGGRWGGRKGVLNIWNVFTCRKWRWIIRGCLTH